MGYGDDSMYWIIRTYKLGFSGKYVVFTVILVYCG